jgi:hypothetical protein
VQHCIILLGLTSRSGFTTDNFVPLINSVDISSSLMINVLSLEYEGVLCGWHLSVMSVSDSQRQGLPLSNNISFAG